MALGQTNHTIPKMKEYCRFVHNTNDAVSRLAYSGDGKLLASVDGRGEKKDLNLDFLFKLTVEAATHMGNLHYFARVWINIH